MSQMFLYKCVLHVTAVVIDIMLLSATVTTVHVIVLVGAELVVAEEIQK